MSPRVQSGPGLGQRALQAPGDLGLLETGGRMHMASASSRRLSSSKLAQAMLCPHIPGWVARAGPLTPQPWAGAEGGYLSPCWPAA